MLTIKSVAAGAVVLSAGLGVASASPALADTAHQSRPAATSRPAVFRSATTYRSTTSSYRSYTSTHSSSRYVASTYATSTDATSTAATANTASSTTTPSTTTASTTTASTTTTSSTTTAASATGACTLGAAANGTTCDQAIAYMLAQQASGSTAWHDRCLGLVSQAYGGAFSGYGTAAQAAAAVSAAGLMHSTTDLSSIPRGAVVWFANSSGSGHVAISLGNGQAISSDVPNGSVGAGSGAVGVVSLSYFTQSWGQTLIGWSAPRA